MTKIAATEQCDFKVKASPQTAYDFFSQPARLREAMEGVQQCEIGTEGKVHWVLEEKADQGVRFQPDYVVVYQGDGKKTIRWHSVEGNMGNRGEVCIEPSPDGGSLIRYRETVEPDLPITPLMARLIRPIVVRELRSDLSRFLERAEKRLAAVRGREDVLNT